MNVVCEDFPEVAEFVDGVVKRRRLHMCFPGLLIGTATLRAHVREDGRFWLSFEDDRGHKRFETGPVAVRADSTWDEVADATYLALAALEVERAVVGRQLEASLSSEEQLTV